MVYAQKFHICIVWLYYLQMFANFSKLQQFIGSCFCFTSRTLYHNHKMDIVPGWNLLFAFNCLKQYLHCAFHSYSCFYTESNSDIFVRIPWSLLFWLENLEEVSIHALSLTTRRDVVVDPCSVSNDIKFWLKGVLTDFETGSRINKKSIQFLIKLNIFSDPIVLIPCLS